MSAGRKALVVATYAYADPGLGRLAAPEHDAEALAAVLEDPDIAGFDVTTLVNQPHHVVGEAIADFFGNCRRDDLTLLYFSGHGVKDDEGRLHLAMTNTRREALMFTAISAAQLNEAMDACGSRRKVLVLDCCYSGAFPAGRTAKSDEGVQTLERFQGKGRAVLTASDATQYAFEGDHLTGSGTSSVFTRHLVEAIRSGKADLDEDGDIALDELYSYVREKVVAEVPQQRPKKQEDVDGRILIARNVHWTLPAHLRHAIDSPISAQRLSAVEGLAHLYRVGNEVVRTIVAGQLAALADDDSRSVSAAASAHVERIRGGSAAGESPVAMAAPPPPPPRTTVMSKVPAPPPVTGPPTSPSPSTSTPPRPAVPSESRLSLLLSLTVVGIALQVLSRVVVFEANSGNPAANAGLATRPWLLAVGLPVLLAIVLMLAWRRAPWMLPLAGGLVAGAGLAQLDQALGYARYFLHPEVSDLPGPGFWAGALGSVVLLGCVVALFRRPEFRARPALRHDWLAVVAALVVLGAVVAKVVAFRTAWPWFTQNEAAIILALACLPLAVLSLNPAQRILGLTAVTVLGPWVCAAHIYALIYDSYPVEEGASAAVLAIGTALVSVAACWLAQLGPHRGVPAPEAEGPAGGSVRVGDVRRPHD